MSSGTSDTVINGRYKIREELGQGGMATVYAAEDLQKNTPVAIKILNVEQLSDERRVARFLREYEILAKLNHQNVVRVYEQGTMEDGAPFFTMELLKGSSLAAYATTERNISTLTTLLTKVAESLSYIHTQGVVFCDLTPANIFVLQSSPEVSEVKIIDFGISRILAAQTAEDRGTKVGTLSYMSPEQSRREEVDARTDIYSFGILAYEILTGEVPYKNEVEYKVEFQHQMAELPSARARNREIPSTLDRLIRRCMEKEREHRFETMVEVVERLQALQNAGENPSFIRKIFKAFGL